MNAVINRAGDTLAYVAAGILFGLAAMTFCDVVGRRFFDAPISGTIEVVELGMAIAAFCAMPRAFLTNSHVSAQFIEGFAVGKFGTFLTLFRGTLMVGMVGLMAYATTLKAIELVEDGRVTIELELPFYPFTSVIAIGMWISALAALIWMIRTLMAPRTSTQTN